MKRSLACVVAALACLATMSWAATVRSFKSSLLLPALPTLALPVPPRQPCSQMSTFRPAHRIDTKWLSLSFRIPMDMNDMDMMMMMMMGGGGMPDPYYALLYQSPAINGPTVSAGASLSIGAPAQWYHDGPRGGRPYDDHGAGNDVHRSQRQRRRGCFVGAELGLHDRASARQVECGQCGRGDPFPWRPAWFRWSNTITLPPITTS